LIKIDTPYRLYTLKYFRVKKVELPFVKYSSSQIKKCYDDRILISHTLNLVNAGKLLSLKFSKHVI